jgi:UDP-N-acetylglucosamine--dolichyl-phosphate N-acetylglucosaminephosphotransferase
MSLAVAQWGRPPPRLLTFTLIPVALSLIAHPLIPLLPAELIEYIPVALPPQPAFPALQANIGFSILAFVGSIWAVPFVSAAFAEKGLKGRDLCKPGGKTSGPWVYASLRQAWC